MPPVFPKAQFPSFGRLTRVMVPELSGGALPVLLLLLLELFASLVRASCHPWELMARTCTPPVVFFSILGVNLSKKAYHKRRV